MEFSMTDKRHINMRQFTAAQKKTIAKFLDEMLKISSNSLDAFRGVKDPPNSTLVSSMRKYWQHVAAAYKFAHSQNQPRKRKMTDGQARLHTDSTIDTSGRGSDEDRSILSAEPNPTGNSAIYDETMGRPGARGGDCSD